MNLVNTLNGYGLVARVLHLIMAAMVIGQLVVGFWMVGLPDFQKAGVYANHKAGGLLILALVLIRLVWRSMNVLPDLPTNTPSWQVLAARSLHRFFYVIMIAMPVTGWVMSTIAGYLPKLGVYTLAFPFVSGESVCIVGQCVGREALGEWSHDAHAYLGVLFVGALSIHIGIAIVHAYWKDGIAERIFIDRT